MIVSRSDFAGVLDKLSRPGFLGLDTETFGVKFDDRLFSLIIADAVDSFYFNFNEKPDHLGRAPAQQYILEKAHLYALETFFRRDGHSYFIHNAKFDLQKLRLEGIIPKGEIHCTMAIERLVYNHYLEHSLEACARRRKMKKDDRVEKYIDEHDLYDGGKPLFSLVPFDIIAPYGEIDGRLVYDIGMDQRRELELDNAS